MTIAEPSYEYGFEDNLQFSKEWADAGIALILTDHFPGARVLSPTNSAEDRRGTDYRLKRMYGLDDVLIDAKVRRKDYANPKGYARSDDLALETWSVVETRKVGWTRDATKQTDYVLWYWVDTGRYVLVPFPPLCRAFSERWQAWKERYKTRTQFTPDHGRPYHSECTFVPRQTVLDAIEGWTEGILKPQRVSEAVQASLFDDVDDIPFN